MIYSSACFRESKEQAGIPFLYHQVVKCDSNGCEYINTDPDITIRIPKGAIAEGQKVHLESGVALYSPFNFPNNTCPISPIVWLCFMEEDVKMKEPFEIKLPHIHKGLIDDNVQKYQVGFLNANHKGLVDMDGQKYFQFERTRNDDVTKFRSTHWQSYGLLKTSHCCYLYIAELDNMEVLDTADYCLAQLTTKYSSLQSTLVQHVFQFYAIFDLPTCREVNQPYC